MTLTRSPSRHLAGFISTITRFDPSSSRTVISRAADPAAGPFRLSAAGRSAAVRRMASPCLAVSRIDSIKPHSRHFNFRGAFPFTGNVASSIAAPGFSCSEEETVRMSREAPVGAGIHAIKAASPAVLKSIMPMPHSSSDGNLWDCVCTEKLCRSPEVLSVRWRA